MQIEAQEARCLLLFHLKVNLKDHVVLVRAEWPYSTGGCFACHSANDPDVCTQPQSMDTLDRLSLIQRHPHPLWRLPGIFTMPFRHVLG